MASALALAGLVASAAAAAMLFSRPGGGISGTSEPGCETWAGVYGDAAKPGVVCAGASGVALFALLETAGAGCTGGVRGAEGQVFPGETISVKSFGGSCVAERGRLPGADILALGMRMDLNRASKEDLEALPGIGPVLADRIAAYRERSGPFRSVEDMLAVKGIGPVKLEKIRPFVEVTGARQAEKRGEGWQGTTK